MVGTAYLASEPGKPPFVSKGASVKPGDTLLIIEAMKVMNPIKADKGGTVTQILVKDGQPVTQALGFVHEMRGQDQRLATRGELFQPLPDQVARLRVEAGCRFVEEHDIRIIDQGAGQRQSPFHAA